MKVQQRNKRGQKHNKVMRQFEQIKRISAKKWYKHNCEFVSSRNHDIDEFISYIKIHKSQQIKQTQYKLKIYKHRNTNFSNIFHSTLYQIESQHATIGEAQFSKRSFSSFMQQNEPTKVKLFKLLKKNRKDISQDNFLNQSKIQDKSMINNFNIRQQIHKQKVRSRSMMLNIEAKGNKNIHQFKNDNLTNSKPLEQNNLFYTKGFHKISQINPQINKKISRQSKVNQRQHLNNFLDSNQCIFLE